LSFLVKAYAKVLYSFTMFMLRAVYSRQKARLFSADKHDKMVKLSGYLAKVFGALVSIVDRETRENYTMTVDYEGCKLLIRPLSHVVDIMMVSGLWEPYVKAVFSRELKKDDIVVDIGANIGAYAIPLAKKVRKVIAFEPHPKISKMLETSIRLNELNNVTLIKKAVGESEKKVLQDISYSSAVYSKVLTYGSGKDNAIVEVESIDLDTALAGEDKVDWMLIDVEGYELNVLKGARKVLRKYSPRIIIEVQRENLESINPVLLAEGYSVNHIYGIYHYATKA
jgi:FkbM family methyltransferase